VADVTPLFPEEQPPEGALPSGASPEMPAPIDLDAPRQICLACGADLSGSTNYRRLRVCPACGYHYAISARRRIAAIADEGSFKETSKWIQSLDPLEFSPRISYRVRLLQDQARTGLSEAAVTGTCSIGGTPVVIIVLDSSFLGGSMGVVVGEKVTLALELAARKKMPCVAMVTSGGTRIQEGVLSLMQMAKTTLATRTLRDKGQAFIVVLSNPLNRAGAWQFRVDGRHHIFRTRGAYRVRSAWRSSGSGWQANRRRAHRRGVPRTRARRCDSQAGKPEA
jgi:DNA-directed RNA polymerase subunit RPC12/RpoP